MIIAHDLGTTGNKASLHDNSGHLLRVTTVHYGTWYGSQGEAEQHPQQWYDAVVEATRELVGQDADRVDAMVISGQMMAAVLLDEAGEPVRPAMIWADNRSVREADQLRQAMDPATAYRLLGHQLNSTYSLEKMMWVARHEPRVWERVRHFCVAKDYVNLQLTGRLVTDRSDASGTNAYDINRGVWSSELIRAAGLDEGIFPEIVDSTTVLGGLLPEPAAAMGLRPDVPVVVGGGDGPIAACGAGVVGPGSNPYAYLGSSSWVQMATAEPLFDPQMRSMTFAHVVPGMFAPTATMVAGGASLEWASEVLAPGLPRRDRIPAILQGVDQAGAADQGLFFLPHLLGERSPYWNPMASGAWVGLGRQHSQANLVRAVLEGVAFNLRTNLQAFEDAGYRFDSVDAIGGGAASDQWLQIMADVWGYPVQRRSIVEEGNSLGAALTAAVALGHATFEDGAGLSEVTRVFEPDPVAVGRYSSQHDVFLAAYRALESWNDIRKGQA